jgi:hypothetical protein
VATTAKWFVAGTEGGRVDILHPQNLEPGPVILTPVHLYRFDIKRTDDEPSAQCLWCGERFIVASPILDTIAALARNAGLAPGQSPCLELPAEAWDEPKLLSKCPQCGGAVKFNPFVADIPPAHGSPAPGPADTQKEPRRKWWHFWK